MKRASTKRVTALNIALIASLSTSIPNAATICSRVARTSALGASTLFATGRIARSFSSAKKNVAMVCAWTPCVASTSNNAPSHASRLRETSKLKSAWPGVSIKFNK